MSRWIVDLATGSGLVQRWSSRQFVLLVLAWEAQEWVCIWHIICSLCPLKYLASAVASCQLLAVSYSVATVSLLRAESAQNNCILVLLRLFVRMYMYTLCLPMCTYARYFKNVPFSFKTRSGRNSYGQFNICICIDRKGSMYVWRKRGL